MTRHPDSIDDVSAPGRAVTLIVALYRISRGLDETGA